MAHRPVLVLVILAALALAGCASSNNGSGGNNSTSTPPAQMSNEQALAALKDTASSMPQKYGMSMNILKGDKQVMSLTGLVDNASGMVFMTITADPSFFQNSTGGMMGGSSSAFSGPIQAYVTKDGTVFVVNGTAMYSPASASQSSTTQLGDFSDPAHSFLAGANTGDITVNSVTPTVFKGKAAYVLNVTDRTNNVTNQAALTIYASPQRLAHLEGSADFANGGSQNGMDPLAGAKAVADFLYDDEVTASVPTSVTRAVALGYKSDHSSFGGSSAANETWTFQVSGGVATSDVEAQVKDASQSGSGASGMMSDASLANVPTLWSMKLSDGTKTQGDLTIAFHDNDNDAKVSKGDTLVITRSGNQDQGGQPPMVVLYDTVSKLYVVPGVGLVALVGVAAGVALLARSRRML